MVKEEFKLLKSNRFDFLKLKSLELRKQIIINSSRNKIPHLGSCLSCIDILTYLYWEELKISPDNPYDENRDIFILSKGHGAPALFHVLAEKGFYSKDLLNQFGKEDSYFHEHPPKPGTIPGIEAATGSLGHGFPMLIGMAMANRCKDISSRLIALLSDGECNEGSIWEAAMFAGGQGLPNITAIIDFNKWQATGRSKDIMAIEPFGEKWLSFGWHCQEIDGHNFFEIYNALQNAKLESNKPSVIIAHTIKGKGVSFMEDDNNWHYRTPNDNELIKACNELEELK